MKVFSVSTKEKLKAIGFYSGDITGRAGEKTIQAIKDIESGVGLEPLDLDHFE